MKLYIMPCGWDRELVIKTAFKSGADLICLVSAHQKKAHTYSATDQITQKVNSYLVKELSKFTAVETLDVNYIDLKDIVIAINNYIKKNKGNEFIINISTGSHLLAATLMLVANTNSIPLEYSLAENHNPKIMKLVENGEDYHCGFSSIKEIPTIPFSPKLSAKEKKLISKLKEKKVLQVHHFVDGAKGNKENQLRSEFHYICKKLQKLGFVEITNHNKRIKVRFTPFGEVFFN
jgi:antitoxin component of RelBE/YafQ-DinJ toxin-antitoxin module